MVEHHTRGISLRNPSVSTNPLNRRNPIHATRSDTIRDPVDNEDDALEFSEIVSCTVSNVDVFQLGKELLRKLVKYSRGVRPAVVGSPVSPSKVGA